MLLLEYRGEHYTVEELSELSGIKPATIRDRLRRGYSVEEAMQDFPTHESVKAFTHASWWEDWLNMPISHLHKIYSDWCIENEYTPVNKQRFSMQLMRMYPNLKVTSKRVGRQSKCQRVIVER